MLGSGGRVFNIKFDFLKGGNTIFRLINQCQRMPIIKSAVKRVRVAEKKRTRNLITKRKYRDLIKQLTTLLEEKKLAEAQKLFPQVQKAIDMAVKKNLLHQNNGARKKSHLAKLTFPQGKGGSKTTPSKRAEIKTKEKSAKKASSPKKETKKESTK